MGDVFDLIAGHLADLRLAGARPNTIRSKQHVLRMLSSTLAGDIVETRRSDVVAFLARSDLSANSRATYLVHIRGFFKWAVEEGHLAADPTEKIRGPKGSRGLPRPMAVQDLQAALETATPSVRCWLLLGALAGLRCCEMATLQGEGILLDREVPTMNVVGKGGRVGIVPLHPVLADELSRWPRAGWLFPHRHRAGDHVLASSISTMVNLHLRGLGIDSTAHTTRHLFGTMTYRLSGNDIRTTQELLRHASPVTTAIYTKVEPGRTAEVVSQLDYVRIA